MEINFAFLNVWLSSSIACNEFARNLQSGDTGASSSFNVNSSVFLASVGKLPTEMKLSLRRLWTVNSDIFSKHNSEIKKKWFSLFYSCEL